MATLTPRRVRRGQKLIANNRRPVGPGSLHDVDDCAPDTTSFTGVNTLVECVKCCKRLA